MCIRDRDNGIQKLNVTLDSTSEGTNEKIEINEDPSTLLSQNKSNKNQENIQTMEIKTKKMHQRKLINTREELEMMKDGLLERFNLPITCLLYTSRCV